MIYPNVFAIQAAWTVKNIPEKLNLKILTISHLHEKNWEKTGELDVFAHPVKKSGKIVGENNVAVVKKFYTQVFW